MFTSSRRIIEHEILDEQTPEAGRRASATWCASIAISADMKRHGKRLKTIAPDGPFTVLDIGAASGDTGEVIRAEYPQAEGTSLDYKLHHLRAAGSPKVAGDAFRTAIPGA